MIRRPLPLAAIASGFILTACASGDGTWPSLARRPGEAGGDCCGASAATPPTPTVPQTAPPPPAEAVPVPSAPAPASVDLDSLEKQLGEARAAWEAQRARAEAAVRAATGKSPGETAWAEAELELSRLEEKGAEFRDISDQIGVVTSPEQAVRLSGEALAAYDAHIAAFGALRQQLAPARK